MDKISVIVPVYNTAAYLPACVESILAQTHAALEVLLVDDGSTDESGALCDAYAARDGRVRVLHRANAGVGAARNAGLDACTGDYIGFVDSDDTILPAMYETLLNAMTAQEADVAICGLCESGPAGNLAHAPRPWTLDGAQALEEYLCRPGMSNANWDRLYRRALFDGLRYPGFTCGEDYYINVRTLLRAGRVVQIPDTLYVYRRHTQSVTAQAFSPRRMDALRAGEAAYTALSGGALAGAGAGYIAAYAAQLYPQARAYDRRNGTHYAAELLRAFRRYEPEVDYAALRQYGRGRRALLLRLFKFSPALAGVALRVRAGR